MHSCSCAASISAASILLEHCAVMAYIKGPPVFDEVIQKQTPEKNGYPSSM